MRKFLSFLIAALACSFAPRSDAAAPCIKHAFTSAKSDPADTTLIKPSDWNACHTIEDLAIGEGKLSISDVTTGNTSTKAHGFAPKLSGNANEYLNGNGGFTVPSGFVTPSSSDTLTNKTLDCEGTGNNCTIPTYWDLDLVGCIAGVASSAWNAASTSAPTFECDTGTNRITGHALWPNVDGNYAVQISRFLAPGWGGQLDARIVWWTAATTGNAKFNIATKCYGTGDADDAAFNTSTSVASTAQGTSNRPNIATMTNIDTTGCAANKIMRILFWRDRTETGDTLDDTIAVEKVFFTTRITH